MAPMHRLLPLLALVLLPQESPRDAARAAVAKTAGSSYRYRAGGRFERGGEFVPPASHGVLLHPHLDDRSSLTPLGLIHGVTG